MTLTLKDAHEFVEKVRERKKKLVFHLDEDLGDHAMYDDILEEIENSTNMYTIDRLIKLVRELLSFHEIII